MVTTTRAITARWKKGHLTHLLVQSQHWQVLRPAVLYTKTNLPLLFLSEIRAKALSNWWNLFFSDPENKKRYFFLNTNLYFGLEFYFLALSLTQFFTIFDFSWHKTSCTKGERKTRNKSVGWEMCCGKEHNIDWGTSLFESLQGAWQLHPFSGMLINSSWKKIPEQAGIFCPRRGYSTAPEMKVVQT